VSLRLLHSASVERETGLRIPDARSVDLSLIPTSHDLAAFDEFAPRAGGPDAVEAKSPAAGAGGTLSTSGGRASDFASFQ
jgi:hypothetical protein